MSAKPVYLVTGASGFIGQHVCRLLVQEGKVVVRAIVRHDVDWLKDLGVETFVGDLEEASSWQCALEDVDVVMHCAGDPVFGNGPHYQRTNVLTTERLLGVLKKRAVKLTQFVFVSTIGAVDRSREDACVKALDEGIEPHPTSDYGRSKLVAEKLVRNSGLPFCIVRPAMVVGCDMRLNSHFAVFTRHALRGSLFGRLRWPGSMSVLHVEDLAKALILCARSPGAKGKTFFCAGEPVVIGHYLEHCRPAAWRLPLGWAASLARVFPQFVPFRLKALLLPALVADDSALRALGWHSGKCWREATAGVIEREKARLDPMEDPRGQTVITGAASGLGRALVETLAPVRRQLLLIDRNEVGLRELAARHPHCRVLATDLSRDNAHLDIVGSAEWNAFPIAELFACAGVGVRGAFTNLPLSRQIDMLKVNVQARLTLMHAVVQNMIRCQFGRIVLISSSSAFQPLPYMSLYAASNAALLSFGEGVAAELRDKGIHMLTVCPGGMKTAFQASAGVKELEGEKLMPPEKVARAILVALSRNRMTVYVSFRSLAMSLLARVLPRRATVTLWETLMRKMR